MTPGPDPPFQVPTAATTCRGPGSTARVQHLSCTCVDRDGSSGPSWDRSRLRRLPDPRRIGCNAPWAISPRSSTKPSSTTLTSQQQHDRHNHCQPNPGQSRSSWIRAGWTSGRWAAGRPIDDPGAWPTLRRPQRRPRTGRVRPRHRVAKGGRCSSSVRACLRRARRSAPASKPGNCMGVAPECARRAAPWPSEGPGRWRGSGTQLNGSHR